MVSTNASSTAQSVAVAQPYRSQSYTTGIPVLHSELPAEILPHTQSSAVLLSFLGLNVD